MRFGDNTLTNIMFGNNQITKRMYGDKLIWENNPYTADLTENLIAHYLLNNNADDCVGDYDGSVSGTVDFTGDRLDSLSGSVTIPDSSASSCSYWKDTGSGFNFTYTTTIPTSLVTDNYSNLRMYSDTKDASFQSELEAEGYYPKPLPLPTTSGLVAHYPLTGTAEDSTGNYDGVETGVSYVDDAELGSVSSFNGSSDFITISSFNNTNHISSMAFSCWAYFTDVTLNCPLMSKRNEAGDNDFEFAIGASKIKGLFWGLSDIDIESASGLMTNDTWHHFVFRYDGSTIKLYLDDVEVGSATSTGDISNTTPSLRLGSNWYSHYHNGKMRDARLYDEALTVQEITNIYNYEKNFRSIDITDGLIAYYPLKNNSSDNYFNEYDATDDAGVSYNGTMATLPAGDNIAFPSAHGFVEAYYIKDGINIRTTTEADLNSLTDCTLREIRKYNKLLSTEQQQIIGYTT